MALNPANLADYLLPPKAKVLLRGLLSPLIGFTTVSSWEEAVRKSVGYEDADVVASAVKAEVIRAGNRWIDGRTMQIATAFASSKAETRPIKVLDIGGADGHYFHELEGLLGTGVFDWTVLETEPMAARFAVQASQSLRWVFDSASLEIQYDVVLLSSVLQYVQDPDSLLHMACQRGKSVIINRLPVVSGDKDIPTVQHLRMYGRRGSYPAWFFSKDRIFAVLSELGVVDASWNVPEDRHVLRFREVQSIGILITPN